MKFWTQPDRGWNNGYVKSPVTAQLTICRQTKGQNQIVTIAGKLISMYGLVRNKESVRKSITKSFSLYFSNPKLPSYLNPFPLAMPQQHLAEPVPSVPRTKYAERTFLGQSLKSPALSVHFDWSRWNHASHGAR